MTAKIEACYVYIGYQKVMSTMSQERLRILSESFNRTLKGMLESDIRATAPLLLPFQIPSLSWTLIEIL